MVSTNGVHEPLMGKSVVWGAQSSLETKLSGLDMDLPLEAVVLILDRLSLRDLLALNFSCNAFDTWSRYATRFWKLPLLRFPVPSALLGRILTGCG